MADFRVVEQQEAAAWMAEPGVQARVAAAGAAALPVVGGLLVGPGGHGSRWEGVRWVCLGDGATWMAVAGEGREGALCATASADGPLMLTHAGRLPGWVDLRGPEGRPAAVQEVRAGELLPRHRARLAVPGRRFAWSPERLVLAALAGGLLVWGLHRWGGLGWSLVPAFLVGWGLVEVALGLAVQRCAEPPLAGLRRLLRVAEAPAPHVGQERGPRRSRPSPQS